MSTYLRALRPAKTVAGSEDSLLFLRVSPLWGGGRKQSQAYTGSAFACTSVRVRACPCVSAVQVRAYHTKRYANARNMHLKLWAFIRPAHMMHEEIERIYSQTHTLIQM
jgi:hypothetical protein